MSQRAVFVSDLHLVSPEDAKTKLFERFLREQKSKTTHVFLVGDIFDLWVGDHAYFADRFAGVVSEIRNLVESGVEVHYFEGNHDLHLTKFWSEKLGARVHKDSAEFTLNGLRLRVEHGDLINPEDHGYLFLRAFLRSKPMTFLSHALPEVTVKAIGERASRASRDYTSTAKARPTDHIRDLIRAHAKRESEKAPFDLIITGHVHVPDDFTFDINGRQVRSINLGSWFEPPRALLLDDQGVHFEELDLEAGT